MSRQPSVIRRVENELAAATWADIGFAITGRRTETTRKLAFMIYQNAMKKIRARSESVRKLRELIEFRNAERDRAKNSFPDWEVE